MTFFDENFYYAPFFIQRGGIITEITVLHFAIVELVFRRGCHRVGKANIGASPVLPSILIIIAVVIGEGSVRTRNIIHHNDHSIV